MRAAVVLAVLAVLGLYSFACFYAERRRDRRAAARQHRPGGGPQAGGPFGFAPGFVAEMTARFDAVAAEHDRGVDAVLAGVVARQLPVVGVDPGPERSEVTFSDGTRMTLVATSPLPVLLAVAERVGSGGGPLLTGAVVRGRRRRLRFDLGGQVAEVYATVTST